MWDQTSHLVIKISNNNYMVGVFGASHRHLTTFRSGLGLRRIRSQRTCSENPAVVRCPAIGRSRRILLKNAVGTLRIAALTSSTWS